MNKSRACRSVSKSLQNKTGMMEDVQGVGGNDEGGGEKSQAWVKGIAGSNIGAHGGPLFLPGLVSPFVNAREFQATATQHLQNLQRELDDDTFDDDNDIDTSIDDLKIPTDEEILEKVFEVAFKSSTQSTLLDEQQLEDSAAREGPIDTEEKGDEAAAITETGSRSTKGKRKRGRKFDRQTRAGELGSEGIIKAEELTKLKIQKEEEKEKSQLHSLKSKANEKAIAKSEKLERLNALKFITSNLKTKHVSMNEFQPVQNPEVVMCIEFYHNTRKDHKVQEFLVLGRQPLTVLRDKLYCLTDQLMQKSNQAVPSGYFMIENIFYNDMRDPRAIDYSKPIIDWVNNNRDEALEKWKAVVASGFKKKEKSLFESSSLSDSLPSFRAANMATTCFADLRCRLGVRYLYCHQGDCKHNIVIRDMRLFHPEDVQNKMAYPLLTFQPRVRHRKCSICDIYRAKKVTYDDKWAPKNPSYFCESCYYLLHYSADGSLIYDDFRVYDYYHE